MTEEKRKESVQQAAKYAVILSAKISEVFQDDDDPLTSGLLEELQDSDNLTVFMHAVMNMLPTHVYNKLTGNNANNIDVNHLANKLIMQYSNRD